MRSLGLNLAPVGWLLQTPRPLTPAQVIAADRWVAAAGLTVETPSEPPADNLSRLAAEATAAGALVALGVLAMTIGLLTHVPAADLTALLAGLPRRRHLTKLITRAYHSDINFSQGNAPWHTGQDPPGSPDKADK